MINDIKNVRVIATRKKTNMLNTDATLHLQSILIGNRLAYRWKDSSAEAGNWSSMNDAMKFGTRYAKMNRFDILKEQTTMKSFKQFTEACWIGYKANGLKRKSGRLVPNCVPVTETAAWTRKAGKNPEGGLNARGVASYRAENPGSKLKMAVTTPPSKLKPGSKSAKRRKSFCARMGGMPGAMRDENGKPTRKALALRKWNC
jgi:hypothetical protein